MPPYLTAAKLVNYLPSIELGLVDKLREFRNHEYYGSKECGDLFAKFELAFSDYKYFSNKYIPPGTVLVTSVDASTTIDFSGFDVDDLANGMQVIVRTNINGVVYELADFYGDFVEVSLTIFLLAIATAINNGTTGFTATSNATSITITCPTNLGSIPNGSSVSILFPGYYRFVSACLAESGAGVGSPGWTGIQYNPNDEYGYATNRSGNLKTYWWDGVGDPLIPPPATGSITQCVATAPGNHNRGLVLNPNNNKLYIGSDDLFPPLINNYTTALGAICGAPISLAPITLPQFFAGVFNPVDQCVYYGSVFGGAFYMYKRTEANAYVQISLIDEIGWSMQFPAQSSGSSGNLQLMAVDGQGRVWVIGLVNDGVSGDEWGFAITDSAGGLLSPTLIKLPPIGSGSGPNAITYISSNNTIAILYSANMLIYDMSGTLLDTISVATGVGTAKSFFYDSIRDKFLVGYNGNDLFIYNSDGSNHNNFSLNGTISGNVDAISLDQFGFLWLAISDVPGQKLFMAKMEWNQIGEAYNGIFTGGVTGETWDEDQNCLTDTEANHQFDQLLMWLGISDCGENTLSEQTSIEELLRGTRLLGTHTGKFITTSTGAYIRIS